MNRMQSFEQSWAARHGVPVESMVQYRFESREGYRLPDMAAHYRTYCDALDSVVVEVPSLRFHIEDFREAFIENIEAVGGRIKS